MPTKTPMSAAQPSARTNAGRRPPATRSRPQSRSSRRFSPSATAVQRASATAGIPIPPAASRLIATPSTAAPSPEAAIGRRRQSGRPSTTAPAQAAPRISQRKKRSPANGFERPHDRGQEPAPPREGHQPAQPPRRRGRFRLGVDLGIGRGVAALPPFGCGALLRRPRRAESLSEGQPQRGHQGQGGHDSGGRPDLEDEVVRVDDLLARPGELVADVGPGEVARPVPGQPGPRAVGDHAPGPDPVLGPIAQRLGRLGEDLAVEPPRRHPRGHQRRHDDEPRDRARREPTRRHPAPLAPGEDRQRRRQAEVGAPALGQEQAGQHGSAERGGQRQRPGARAPALAVLEVVPADRHEEDQRPDAGTRPASSPAPKVEYGSFEPSTRSSKSFCAGVPGVIPASRRASTVWDA